MNEQAPRFVDVVRFFQKQKFDGKCPICSGTSWAIASEEGSDQVNIFVIPLNGEDQGLPAIAVSCNQCGWVRNHNLLTITSWIELNPEDSSEPASTPDGADQEGLPNG